MSGYEANELDRDGATGGTAMDETAEYGGSLTFQIDLPDGSYEVIPTLGDTANFTHSAKVFVQGTQVDTVSTSGGEIVTPMYVATVTDGELTFGLQGTVVNGTDDGLAVIEGLEIIPLQFDIGPTNQVVANGDTSLTQADWGSTVGYGLAYPLSNSNAWDRGMVAGSTALTRDDMYGSQLTFQFYLPDGSYDVTPTLGDLDGATAAEVFLQGTQVDTVVTTSGEVVSPTYTVTVTDGVLTLGLTGVSDPGTEGVAVIGGLDIAPASEGQQQEQMMIADPALSSGAETGSSSPSPAAETLSGPVASAKVGSAGGSLAPLDAGSQGSLKTAVGVLAVTDRPAAGLLTVNGSSPFAFGSRFFFAAMPPRPRIAQGLPSKKWPFGISGAS